MTTGEYGATLGLSVAQPLGKELSKPSLRATERNELSVYSCSLVLFASWVFPTEAVPDSSSLPAYYC